AGSPVDPGVHPTLGLAGDPLRDLVAGALRALQRGNPRDDGRQREQSRSDVAAAERARGVERDGLHVTEDGRLVDGEARERPERAEEPARLPVGIAGALVRRERVEKALAAAGRAASG